ncbi:MAG: hypothetical protein H7337_07225 [Rhizobacter sp.]|nr:hypothetical protein [Rhizobacter sp.]
MQAMPITLPRARHLLALLPVLGTAMAGFIVALLAAGCAAPPQAVPSNTELAFEAAVAQATDGLMAQTKKLPAFLAKVESKMAKRGDRC